MSLIKKAILESQKDLKINTEAMEKAIENEAEKKIAMETKANEVMNTGATNLGTELIPTNVMHPGLELVPTYSNLMTLLPGNQGNNLAVSDDFPIIGEANLMVQNTEWTTGTGVTTPANNGPMTDKITISQGQLKTTVSISKRELNYAVENNLEGKVTSKIQMVNARTIDSNIINGDSATSGNVNLDGGTPSGFAYLEVANGIRKVAIADGNTHDVGTLSEADFVAVKSLLNDGYGADLENLLWILPQNVYDKCLLLDGLITKDKSDFDTLKTGRFGRIFGIKVMVARDMPALAQATGKVSSTAGSNTTGQFALVYTPAVQYGFGQPLEVEREVVPGRGINLIATTEFGATIAYDKAGLGKTVGLGVNVTL